MACKADRAESPFNKSGHPGMCMMFETRRKIRSTAVDDEAGRDLGPPLAASPPPQTSASTLPPPPPHAENDGLRCLSSGVHVLPDCAALCSAPLHRAVAQASALESALSSALNKADAWGMDDVICGSPWIASSTLPYRIQNSRLVTVSVQCTALANSCHISSLPWRHKW